MCESTYNLAIFTSPSPMEQKFNRVFWRIESEKFLRSVTQHWDILSLLFRMKHIVFVMDRNAVYEGQSCASRYPNLNIYLSILIRLLCLPRSSGTNFLNVLRNDRSSAGLPFIGFHNFSAWSLDCMITNDLGFRVNLFDFLVDITSRCPTGWDFRCIASARWLLLHFGTDETDLWASPVHNVWLLVFGTVYGIRVWD